MKKKFDLFLRRNLREQRKILFKTNKRIIGFVFSTFGGLERERQSLFPREHVY